MSKVTRKSKSGKAADRPKKPYPDFPLSCHASGAWQKKINGKVHYFGKWGRVVKGVLTRVDGDGWKEALELYKAQADDLHAGRTPRQTSGDGLTLAELCNRYLTSKIRKLRSNELSGRTFQAYKLTTDRLITQFGKTRRVADLASDDFEALRSQISERWGPVALGNEIVRVKGVFRYGYESGLIDRPVRYGPAFVKPSMSVLRKHRAAGGKRLFDRAEIHRMLETASVPMRAMILLGLNCGYGNTDVADLSQSALDLEGGWVDFPRPKTGIDRRCPLWPETIEAIKAAIEVRRKPKAEADTDCVFIRRGGTRYVQITESSRSDTVTLEFAKLLKQLEVNGRVGLGFYSLRHTHRTISDGAKDPVACNTIMGHADHTMGGVYREGIDDERLVDVAEHVRGWLFGQEGGEG